MLVYRIENEYGEGPYRNRFGTDLFQHDGLSENHPGPSKDDFYFPEVGTLRCFENDEHFELLKEFIHDDVLFAFKNKDQLKNWFTKSERKKMKQHGFKIATYEVSEKAVRLSSHQAMFTKHKAYQTGTIEFGKLGGLSKL